MNQPKTCLQCGAELPGHALAGLCPGCVARVVFAEREEAPEKFKLTLPEEPPPETLREGPGTHIGRYKLLEQIGEGGFGVVYLADQTEPVQRKVALKVLKAGMDTKEVIARFEAERQALALMDHPNIARVLDAGATNTGRPFFVMELVKGIPITDFCDQQLRSPTDRLALFIKVCSAVQHAHQKGIIHRDLKPSNVLVTLYDGEPVPKVIDFGIAKALGTKLTKKTLFTGFARLLGTPAYMSPEQAELSGLDVDTRSDIYSLGVLLYELLTGVTPFDKEALAKAALDEVRRMIREAEPPRPSTRLRTLGDGLAEVARRRNTEPAALNRLVHGDLDWIVMKCLEKDRSRRYATVNGLAMDLQRYLSFEPVMARPRSRIYEFQKTVRRHKFGFAATAALITVLAAGVLAATLQATRARRAERVARIALSKSSLVAQFFKSMLEGVGPSVAKGRDTVILNEILEATEKRIRNDLSGHPEVAGELQSTIGLVYLELGEFVKAERMFREVRENSRELYGNKSKDMAACLDNLGVALTYQGKWAEAESLHAMALAMNTHFLGPEDVATLKSLNNLALVLGEQNKLAEAERLQRQGVASARKKPDLPPETLASYLSNLATVLQNQGKLAEAESHFRDALELMTHKSPEPNITVATLLNNLAIVVGWQGDLDKAADLHRQALDMRRKLFDGLHPHIANSMQNLGTVLRDQGKLTDAEPLLAGALEINRTVHGPEHPEVAASLDNLGKLLQRQGKLAEAAGFIRQASVMDEKLFGPEHPQTAKTVNNLAAVLYDQGKFPEAESCFRRCLKIYQLTWGDHPEVATTLQNIGLTLRKQDNLEAAADFVRRALAMRQRVFHDEHPAVASSLRALAEIHKLRGNLSEMNLAVQACLKIRRKQMPDDWETFEAQALLGTCLLLQQKYAEAELELQSGYNGMKHREDRIPSKAKIRVKEALESLVQLHEATGALDKAAEWKGKLAEFNHASSPDSQHP